MFGEMVKTARVGKKIGLREFCKLASVDASNWSKIERGLLAAPRDEEKLRRIAEVLGIEEGSPQFEKLMDEAAIAAGIIPKDFLSDKAVLDSLPLFFRTIRSEKPTAEEIEKIIQKIREGNHPERN